MVGDEKNNKNNELTNGLIKNDIITIEFMANITDLDLSNGKLSSLDENLKLPPNILHLKLSHNKLTKVPPNVLNLENVKTVDLSFNSIEFFNEKPNFCHNLTRLNLKSNNLKGPPLWVWNERPEKLVYMNLSNNENICLSFVNGNFEEILQIKISVMEIDLHNCRLSKYAKFMATFTEAKVVILGCDDYSHIKANNLDHIPFAGLNECHKIEKLDLCNTQLYHINSSIDIYKNLKELNLSQNSITSLPDEFGNLMYLETCILSYNNILYLPDTMYKLQKLITLKLDYNKLCMLPENLHEISSLTILDLYNNNLCEGLDRINNFEELDFAQNYFDEPNNEEYLEKKAKLRANYCDRIDGRKLEAVNDNSDGSYESCDEDDEELCALIHGNSGRGNSEQEVANSRSSSPEDWDSDSHWIPQYYKPVTPPKSPWLFFVKKKMEEGNFCPMDAHILSVGDQVKYEKMCHPDVVHESDGQFDDYSDDDS
uniref:Disease resistance R13L4/SHOC-2-like LRR domain-containing protein n=1 Tax=Heliothis virescens TaxID=7102 RepID=A0A2A4IT54_HELVI